MKQATTIRKRFSIIVVAILLAAALLFASSAFYSGKVFAQDADYTGWHETLTINNSQFENTGSGDIPTPSGWAGARIGDAPSASVKSGVLQLDSYSANKDKYKLDIYDEYKNTRPDSPFGKGDSASGSGYFQGTNRNVLLINANGTPTAYGYTSESFTLAPNSYYKINVWLKTGSIGPSGGAAILVNGLGDEPVGFTGINTETLAADQNYTDKYLGWFDYTLYIETSSFISSSATLSLQLGYDEVGGMTKGYVMYDNITATQLSSKSYYEETARIAAGSARKKAVSFNEGELLPGGDFTTPGEFGTIVGSGYASKQYLNAAAGLPAENSLGLEKKLYAPNEISTDFNNVFAISTYKDGKFESAYGGIESKEFVIERYSYYRISAWYNSESVEGGDGVAATLMYKSVKNQGDFTSDVTASLALSAENYNHNGWNELAIYVKGSDFSDYSAKLALSLGSKSNPAKGVALFDDVKIQKLTPAEYNDNSANGNKTVTFDTATDSSGIGNGWFNTVGTYEELEYEISGGEKTLKKPLAPANWTMHTTADVATSGYSQTAVSTDEAVYGLVPVEELGNINGLTKTWGNVLKMSSKENTAFCYASEEFTVTASGYNTVAVTLTADGLKGYGANLVLKKGGLVVSTIEKITESGTYTFYIKGGDKDSAMTLELWLGLNDRVDNSTKLASGTVYFTGVAFKSDSTEEIYNAKAESYKYGRSNPDVREGISYAAVYLGAEDFTLFDSYDNGSIKHPYNWSVSKGTGKVVYGIFDSTNKEGSDIPGDYENGGKQYALILQNVEKTYSELTLNNSYTLAADSYYKLTVSVKADIPEEYLENENAVGAYIKLTNGDYRFDFKDTSVTEDSIVNDEAFRTYTFYIKAPSAETTTAISVGLGGSEKSNQAVVGRVYVNGITLEDLSNIEYDELVADLKDDENLIDDCSMRVDLAAGETTDDGAEDDTEGAETTEPTEPSGGLEWWLIPSILLAVAVIIAIVGSFIRKRIESRPKKADVSKQSSYDRRRLTEKSTADDSKKAEAANKPNDTFESFDDTKNFDDVTDATEIKESEVSEIVKSEDTAKTETAAPAQPEETTENAEPATENADATDDKEATEALDEAPEDSDKKPSEAEKTEVKAVPSDNKGADKAESEKQDYVDDFED